MNDIPKVEGCNAIFKRKALLAQWDGVSWEPVKSFRV